MLTGRSRNTGVQQSYAYPFLDRSRKHLFVLNYADQTVSVVDTSTDTVESTITLPGTATGESQNWNFRCLHYRPIDDCIYLYGFQRVCKIDANPNSGTFKNVYNLAGTQNASSALNIGGSYNYADCAYDWNRDRVYLTNTSSVNFAYWDFSYNVSFVGNLVASGKYFTFQNGSVFHLPPNKIIYPNGGGSGIYDKDDIPSFALLARATGTLFGSFCAIKKYNYVVLGFGVMDFLDSTTYKRQFVYGGVGGSSVYSQMVQSLVYLPDYELIMGSLKQNTTVYFYDLLNNTGLGSFTRPNVEANASTTGGCVYSLNSKKVYMMSNGSTSPVNRLHIFNPQTWIDNGKVSLSDMYQGYINCGNMIDTAVIFLEHRLCMNHIIPY